MSLTAAGKGTAAKPGQNLRQKAGLNRAILDSAPGGWLSLLTCNAAEAGGRVIVVDPRQHRPSQPDPVRGAVRQKPLHERPHVLPDGRVLGRDQASAWVLWPIGQRLLGEEQARSRGTETAARAA
jgi:putative transposase